MQVFWGQRFNCQFGFILHIPLNFVFFGTEIQSFTALFIWKLDHYISQNVREYKPTEMRKTKSRCLDRAKSFHIRRKLPYSSKKRKRKMWHVKFMSNKMEICKLVNVFNLKRMQPQIRTSQGKIASTRWFVRLMWGTAVKTDGMEVLPKWFDVNLYPVSQSKCWQRENILSGFELS